MGIFDCFKKKERRIEHPPNEPLKVPKESKDRLRILILSGHQPGGGALTYIPNLSEDEWNTMVVDEIYGNYEGKHDLLKMEYRYEKSYTSYVKRVKEFCKKHKPDIVIEQHLNAAGIPEARGCEMLIPTNDKTAWYAFQIISNFSIRFRITPRGWYKKYQGVKARKRSDRGGYFLNEIAKTGAHPMIFEPFFCDYRSTDSLQFLDKNDYGTKDMARFLIEMINLL